MSIERRSILGALSGGLGFATTMLQSLVLVPVLLQYLGQRSYGTWLGLSALMSSLIVLDTSHQSYLGGEFNQQYATSKQELGRTLASGLRVALVLGCVEVVLAIILGATPLLPRILGQDPAEAAREHVALGFLCLVGLWVLPGSIGGILVRLFPPAGMYSWSQIWSVVFKLGQTAALVVAAMLGGSIVQICFVSGMANLLLSIWLFVFIYRRFHDVWPSWTAGNWRHGFRNFGKSTVLTGVGLLAQAQGSWLLLLVSSVLGPGATTAFGTLRTVSNTFLQGIALLHGPLSPEVARFHARREPQKLASAFAASWWLSGMALNLAMVLALPVMERLYMLWTRGRVEFNAPLFFLLSLAVCIKGVGAPLTNYLVSINNLRAQSAAIFLQCLVVFGLAALFVPRMGLTGLGAALAAGESVGSLLVPVFFVLLELKALEGDFPWLHFGFAVAGMSTVAVAYLLVHSGLAATWTASAAAALALCAVQIVQWRLLPDDLRNRFRRVAALRWGGAA